MHLRWLPSIRKEPPERVEPHVFRSWVLQLARALSYYMPGLRRGRIEVSAQSRVCDAMWPFGGLV